MWHKLRKNTVNFIGETTVDTIPLFAGILPLILVTTLLHDVIFSSIQNGLARWVVSLLSGLVIEAFAIAVMIVEHKVKMHNKANPDYLVEYNASLAKLSYILLVTLVVVLGHILPHLFGIHYEYLTLIPMIGIGWFAYQIFSVSFTLDEIKEQIEADKLANATAQFAERGKIKAEAERIQAEAELARARAELERARVEKAKVKAEKKAQKPRAQRLDWRRSSFETIKAALDNGASPPPMTPLERQRLDELVEKAHVVTVSDVCEIFGLSPSAARNLLRIGYAHGVLKVNGNKYLLNGK